jgi:hypothetical protein
LADLGHVSCKAEFANIFDKERKEARHTEVLHQLGVVVCVDMSHWVFSVRRGMDGGDMLDGSSEVTLAVVRLPQEVMKTGTLG